MLGNRGSDCDTDDEDYDEDHDIDVAMDTEGPQPEVVVIEGHEYITKMVAGDPTDGDTLEEHKECTKNFIAAHADEKKGMSACYHQTGTFNGICRHGICLKVCDMIQSGEL